MLLSIVLSEMCQLTGVMTAVGTSFASDKDSISEARLGDMMLLEPELMLGVTDSFTETKDSKFTLNILKCPKSLFISPSLYIMTSSGYCGTIQGIN